ncbi:hypothetical protein R70723_18740 [Paenibacillus sp. FSL R7-0273]|uniref:GNAT family N-acetyltransferase n=1 Tax=Paenibacillus sp. FSL R7-0273 TaxID=1536772 RepID=UPI0004F72CA4|nr:GNAT family N-acetyltransferase [Paenibacillus sp. FSL R7-0273]AIQ47705.1 hypothetical protein R70723_18740 [Paenibacillus sp. FSL R7-0273]OMF95736.1 hypothetical protein BK144_03895 [Paenibacillus sp. FSL R7-0273]
MLKTDELIIRRMNETDYEQLTSWLNNKDVIEFYGNSNDPFDLARVIEKYEPRVKGLHMVKPCIVQYEETPIGFMQFYELNPSKLKEYGYNTNEHVFGMDQFIGESNFLGKGIGTKMVKSLTEYIQKKLNGSIIVMDPHILNTRAISCYEKCSFVKKKVISGEFWLMECKKK